MKAFLSHSSHDKPLVEEVAHKLGAEQVELDSHTFDNGLLNVDAIRKALKRSSIFVLFLTEDAIESACVRFEVLLAREFLAKGLVEKFLVICLDVKAFSKAQNEWKDFNFCLHLTSAQSIARRIQHHLIVDHASFSSKHQPYVERSKELNDLSERLMQPNTPRVKGIYVSGNAGIGRRTFARHFYADRYPAVNSVFPEIQIDMLDGYEEIYRKLSQELSSTWPLSSLRARILGFSIADDMGKATQIANLFDQLVDSREAIFVRDGGGLLNNDGAMQPAVKEIFDRIEKRSHPNVVFIAARMVPRNQRDDMELAYSALPSMTDAQIRQLAGFLLVDAEIVYSNDDLETIVSLSDGHPFNVKFIVGTATEYTLPVALADVTELNQWKVRRGSEFLRNIDFSDAEKKILAALRDFSVLDFTTIQAIADDEIDVTGRALVRLIDLHVIEGAGDTYGIAPPLRSAVQRERRFVLDSHQKAQMLEIISNTLKTKTDNDAVSVSMINAGVLAMLHQEQGIPELFSVFLLPSHLVWLARRHYDDRRWSDCARLTADALESADRLSPEGKVEACRLLCLSSARLNKQQNFQKGIDTLRTWAHDSAARSNLHFLLGFNARLGGSLPEAEIHFRKALEEKPGNFSAIRELTTICFVREDLDEAEKFARQAYDIASDNPYILDILLSILIARRPHRVNSSQQEIERLFEILMTVGEEEGRSFYTTRRAEYELKNGHLREASRLIDDAVSKTPGIFAVHALRSQIYLEQGIKSIVSDEIEKMRTVVYRNTGGERRTNLRLFLEIESSYFAAIGDYKSAKEVYGSRSVFTEKEAEEKIKTLEYEQMMTRR